MFEDAVDDVAPFRGIGINAAINDAAVLRLGPDDHRHHRILHLNRSRSGEVGERLLPGIVPVHPVGVGPRAHPGILTRGELDL
jgi:hypothetical protein